MLSLAMVDAEIGRHYYAQDNYYTLEQTLGASNWLGAGAENLGLKGSVDPAVFNSLLEGKLPGEGQVIGHDNPSKKHRGGLDLTFSAPKSVSIAALVLGDDQIIKAHQNAVQMALKMTEQRYAYSRVGTKAKRELEASGNLIVAQFHHTISRSVDPQLHSHCVVLNAIKRNDGKWRAHHTDAIFKNSKYLGLIYQNELAKEVRSLGYETITNSNGTFEIKGFSPEQLESFSKRRRQILDLGGGSQQINRGLVLINRPKKGEIPSTNELHNLWKNELGRHGCQKKPREEISPLPYYNLDFQSSFDHATAHEVSFARESAESFLLQAHLGTVDLMDLQQGFSQALRQGKLIPAKHGLFTTEGALKSEKNILKSLLEGKNKFANLAPSLELPETLTKGQTEAISQIMKAKDQFIAWQGVAGAGKTFALGFAKEGLEKAGYALTGYAPSAEAAKVLEQETGISSTTVAAKLINKGKDPLKSFWIVDEAGLLSAKDCESLMQKAKDQGVRVLFIGDTRQLSSVGAGNPFKLLQANGINTAHLTESKRQNNFELKKAVKHLSRGETDLAINFLNSQTRILPSELRRIKEIAKDYVTLEKSDQEKALVIAGRRDYRKAITKEIRNLLLKNGDLKGTQMIPICQTNDLTPSEIKHGVNLNKHALTVLPNGKLAPVAQFKKNLPFSSIVEKTSLDIAIGDKVMWTRNCRKRKFRNGQEFRVIDNDGPNLVLKDIKGKTHSLSKDEPLFLDHAYVSTVYASQGKTASRALIFLDNAFSKEGLYVATSRAREEVKFYSKGHGELEKIANVTRSKVSAVDVIGDREVKMKQSL